MSRNWLLILTALVATSIAWADKPDPQALLQAAFDNWRASSSISQITMTVHRKDWQRSLQMRAWTRGSDDALVRFTAPPKDAGNATLKTANDTSIFNPKLNRVIKLPASMLAQSWMGSDFSYNDLSKADDVLHRYTHKLLNSTQEDGHEIYTIEALPEPGAPVVWGKLELAVRNDGVLLGETYFDQDMNVVRTMSTEQVGEIGGRPYPLVMIMRPADSPDKWTRIETTSAQFDVEQPGYLFTLSNLQNPRD